MFKSISRFVALLLLLTLSFSCAMAQGEKIHGRVELFSEGAIAVAQRSSAVATYSSSMFDAYVAAQLNEQAATIDVSRYNLPPDDFFNAYATLLNARPELFFVGDEFDVYWDGTYVTEFDPTYKYTGDELTEMVTLFNNSVNEIVEYAMQADSDVGRLLRASDYLCVNYEYDNALTIYSPEILFKEGTGVCQAYMLAYRAVLNELGIPSITVSSNEINHTWNMVNLGDNWYHVDVTWNDPVPDTPQGAYHTNLLLSDTGIIKTGHTSWDDAYEAVPAATDTQYDSAFWRNIYQALAMDGDTVYYIKEADSSSSNKAIYARSLETNTETKIHTYDYGYAHVDYIELHPIWVSGSTIYYGMRDTLYSLPLSGGTAASVYSTGNSAKWLWYPWQIGSKLQFFVAETPESSGTFAQYALPAAAVSVTMSPTVAVLNVGETLQLNAVSSTGSSLIWSSAKPAVATVGARGLVRAVAPGVAEVKASYGSASASCRVVVVGSDVLRLPAQTMSIGSEAFRGGTFQCVELHEGVKIINASAFADNEQLLLVSLPASLTVIAQNAFENCPNVTLLCKAGTSAETFAKNNGIPYMLTD